MGILCHLLRDKTHARGATPMRPYKHLGSWVFEVHLSMISHFRWPDNLRILVAAITNPPLV
jgi:hypothetical protein